MRESCDVDSRVRAPTLLTVPLAVNRKESSYRLMTRLHGAEDMKRGTRWIRLLLRASHERRKPRKTLEGLATQSIEDLTFPVLTVNW
jgi:hypothetical protein